MKIMIKNAFKFLINKFVALLGRSTAGRYVFEQIVGKSMNRKQEIDHNGISLTLSVPNQLNKYRADSFSTKEPETLEWIDSIPTNAVLWDIGANVGLYSCYAAKKRQCRVISFEPSVFNLELLARNIFNNGLTNRITIVPLPLSDTISENLLNMTSTDWGGALSTFGQTYGQDGKNLEKIFEFRTIGLRATDAFVLLKLPQPDYIKIDVDGIEHLILKGAAGVLANVKSVLIEIDENFEKQLVDSNKYLVEAGFEMKEKRHAAMFENSKFEKCFNQIWVKVK